MRIIILLLFVFVTFALNVTEGETIQCTGIWAEGAKLPFKGDMLTSTESISPNGVSSISGSMEGLSLINKGKVSHIDILFSPPLVEVLWAPDSRKFVINMSDGGLVGTWETCIYSIDDRGNPVPIDIQNLIKPISNKIMQCEPKEEANIGIAAWLNNSTEILLIVEVPPHSSCRNMSTITGFRISIETRKIIERISENELRKNWKRVLGCRFIGNQLQE